MFEITAVDVGMEMIRAIKKHGMREVGKLVAEKMPIAAISMYLDIHRAAILTEMTKWVLYNGEFIPVEPRRRGPRKRRQR